MLGFFDFQSFRPNFFLHFLGARGREGQMAELLQQSVRQEGLRQEEHLQDAGKCSGLRRANVLNFEIRKGASLILLIESKESSREKILVNVNSV